VGRDVAGVHVVVAYARFSKAFIEEMGYGSLLVFPFFGAILLECAY